MPKKEEVLLVIFLVAYVALFMFLNFEYTGYASAPDFKIELEKKQYLQNESLGGYILLNFTDNLNYDTKIAVELGEIEKELLLRDILDKLNLTYNTTEGGYEAKNPSISKQLSLPAKIAFLLPKRSVATQISMNVAGDSQEPPSFVSMDVGLDNLKEWLYFGEFSNWDSTYIYPTGLEIAGLGSALEIDTNESYFCELINLPFSKDYRISAYYRKINEGADIKAVILSFDGVRAYGGAERCDLPEQTTLDWYGCDVNFGHGVSGNHLACIFIEKELNENKSYYQLSRDNAVSTAKYDCNALVEGSAVCSQKTSKNYFIRINPALYVRVLNASVNFDYWLTEYNFKERLTNFLVDCKATAVGDCAVPIAIDSENGGKLNLNNLNIRVTEEGGGTSVHDKFYDLNIFPQEISAINQTPLANYSLTVPLSLFSINVPAVEKTLNLKITISPKTKSETIIVSSKEEISKRISSAKDKLNAIKNEYGTIASLLDISLDTAQLNNYQIQLDNIKASNISEEEKKSAQEKLEKEILEYIDKLPNNIIKSKDIADVQMLEPADITLDIVKEDEQMETYHLQRKVDVNVKASEYEVIQNSGGIGHHTIIDKQITPKESLAEIYLYENIPKTIVANINEIKFQDQNYEVVEADPIVKFYYPQLASAVHIIYSVKKGLTASMIYGPKTIIMLKETPEIEEQEEYICGDEICSRPIEDEKICPEDCIKPSINWSLVWIVIIVGIAMFFWINVYTGWIDFRKLTKGKVPFKSKEELKHIKDLIKNAEKAGIKRGLITDSLLREGWKKDQIFFAFEDIEWDKRRELLIKKAPTKTAKLDELTSYVSKCLDFNMPINQVREILANKGWQKEQIENAIKNASKKSVLKSILQMLVRKKQAPKYFFENNLKK